MPLRWAGLGIVGCLLMGAATVAQPPSNALVPFAEAESTTRLARSKHSADFYRLVNQFEPQQNRAFCGPASAVIVLNALRSENTKIEKPKDRSTVPSDVVSRLPPGIDPFFRRYTQNTFFDDKTEVVKPRAVFFGAPPGPGKKPDGGLQLRQLQGMLLSKGASVTIRVVDAKSTEEDIRTELSQNLASSGDYAIVNYFRPVLGQNGGGHISPLGAYDAASDSFLVMDVNPNGQSWVWVPTTKLVEAMRTPDTQENRGYLLVKEGP